MKTLTKYMNAYNEQSNTIELLSFDKPIDESKINEGFGSFLKGVFGSYFKIVGAMSNAAAEVLKPNEKKNFEKAQKDIMASDDTKKALDEKDPDKVVEYINMKYDEFKEEAKLSDETIAKFKIVAAMQFHAQHKDDKAYTAKMSAYIDELKKKSEEVKKFAEDYAKELNDRKEGTDEQNQPSEEEIKDNSKNVKDITQKLGGDENKVKKALKDIIPLEKPQATDKQSLNNEITPIVEAAMPEEVKKFRKMFLSKAVKDEKVRETNKQAIIEVAGAISAAIENIKDKDGNTSKEEVSNFIIYLVSNHETFMKTLAK